MVGGTWTVSPSRPMERSSGSLTNQSIGGFQISHQNIARRQFTGVDLLSVSFPTLLIGQKEGAELSGLGGVEGSDAVGADTKGTSCLTLLPRWAQDGRHGLHNPNPAGLFGGQLLFARYGQTVDLGALLILGNFPLRGDPSLPFQAVQRRIERSGIDPQNLAGIGPDRLTDAVTMPRTPLQGLQNEQIERALQELDPVLIAILLWHVDSLHPSMESVNGAGLMHGGGVLPARCATLEPIGRRIRPVRTWRTFASQPRISPEPRPKASRLSVVLLWTCYQYELHQPEEQVNL